MHPQRATLVDLLDRLLERGVVLEADILVSVAGVPLIALSLRAALAGVDTMLRYGLMGDWLGTATAGTPPTTPTASPPAVPQTAQFRPLANVRSDLSPARALEGLPLPEGPGPGIPRA